MAEESIQSVKRTFLVLESLAGRGSAGVRELHGVVGLSVATVHRILSTLVDLGYVRRNPQTERYELTYKILVLGHSVTQHSGVIQLAHPLLEQLSAQAGETVHFAERSGASIRYIDKVVPSTGVVVMSSYLGMELPLYSTAVGKAIMADLPADEVEEIWNRSDRIPYTPNTISAPEELRRQCLSSLYLTIGETELTYRLLEVRRFGPILENILTLGLMSQADRLAKKGVEKDG